MHEISLIKDLLKKIKTISKSHKNSKIISVQVKLGALSHISASHFREHFKEWTINTPAEGAKLRIKVSKNQKDPHAASILLENVELEFF